MSEEIVHTEERPSIEDRLLLLVHQGIEEIETEVLAFREAANLRLERLLSLERTIGDTFDPGDSRVDRDEPPAPVDSPEDAAPAASPPSAPPPLDPAEATDLSERQALFLAAVRDDPGQSGTAYGRKLGLAQGTASKTLRSLVAAGRLREEGHRRSKRYYVVGSEDRAQLPVEANGADPKKKNGSGPKKKVAEKPAPKGEIEEHVVAALREIGPSSIGEIQDSVEQRDLGTVIGAMKRRGVLIRVEGVPGLPIFDLADRPG